VGLGYVHKIRLLAAPLVLAVEYVPVRGVEGRGVEDRYHVDAGVENDLG